MAGHQGEMEDGNDDEYDQNTLYKYMELLMNKQFKKTLILKI